MFEFENQNPNKVFFYNPWLRFGVFTLSLNSKEFTKSLGLDESCCDDRNFCLSSAERKPQQGTEA